MRLEFNQGVPNECIEWLYKNVGRGNMTSIYDSDEYDWFYKRERVYPQGHEEFDSNFPWKYVPTITVKDPKLAIMFILKWG